MSAAGAVWAALFDGLTLATQYNPLVAIVTAAIAAAISGYPKAPRERQHISELIIAVGWLIGDGLRVLGHGRDLYDGIAITGSDWAAWGTLVVWAAGSLAIGYLLPVFVGTTVGRRVTHGTGWLAAAAIAAGASAAISVIVGALS